jgi:replication factor C large subunit
MDLTNFGIKGNKKEDLSKNNKKINSERNDNKNNNSEILDKVEFINDEKLSFNFDEIRKDLSIETQFKKYLPWFIKYKVEKFEELIITKEIKKILDFFEKRPKNKGLLLVGPPGSGKTTTVYLIGDHFNFEIFEINASDTRNKNSIEETIGDVSKQKSLFGKEKLILIDEVDGVSGTFDRGAIPTIIKYLKNSNFPFIFTANDKESEKIKALKKVCITIDFENHSKELLVKLGEKILKAENISYNKEDLENFVKDRESFDIRGFINDLQASVIGGKFVIDNDLIEIRDYKKRISNLLNKIFYSYPEDAYKSNFYSDINLDDLFLYLEENIPQVFDKKITFYALNELSKADVFRGRITRWQYYKFLVYINFYLTFGVSAHKDEGKISGINTYKRNERILKKWIYNNKYNLLAPRTKAQKDSKNSEKKLIEKIADYYKRSAKKVRKEDIFYFALTFKNSKKFKEYYIKELELNEKEIELIENL